MANRGIVAGLVALNTIGLAACSGGDSKSAGAGGTAAGGVAAAAGGSPTTGGSGTGGTASGGMTTGGVGVAGAGGAGGAGAGGAGAGAACTPLAPTGAARKVIISQIVPGMGIEVFNPGTTPVSISSIWFCSDFDYQQVTAPSGKTAIAPGAFVVLAWPDSPGYALATASGGELLLNLDTFGPTPDNVQSYVCWGNHSGGREPTTQDGISAGVDQLYSGACAPAMTAGALSRKPNTNGMDASSYDSAGAPSLADCSP
ncbi:MAG TPA: hypothetical protein VL137_10370 [Polyangiaceae bacterium]|nr:hypothetical protein [Polyangiaceae bacterium]